MHALLLPSGPARAEALESCRRYLAANLRFWRLGQAFLPGERREDLVCLLAWHCLGREIAEGDSEFERRRGLDELQAELDSALGERARSPIGQLLGHAIRRHDLPEELLRRPLLERRRDEHLSTFETRESLLAHARALAVPEGRLLLRVAGAANPHNEALVDCLSVGIQLSVWLSRLRRDLERGRVRLPFDELARSGVELAALLDGRDQPGLARVLADQVAWTRGFFARGWSLCRELGPGRGRALAFLLRWHAATLSAHEAARFELRRLPEAAGWPRWIACAGASVLSSAAPRF